MFERVREAMRRHWAIDKVSTISDRDIADLGLTRREVETYACLPPDVADRLERIAALHGLTRLALRRPWGDYLEIVMSCGHCAHRRLCSERLGAQATRAEDCSFCPNQERFAARVQAAAH